MEPMRKNGLRVPTSKRLWQVAIDWKLHKQFKVRCVQDGISMNAKVEELIRNYLGSPKKGRREE